MIMISCRPTTTIMSLSCSDCFSDLLCCDEAGTMAEEELSADYYYSPDPPELSCNSDIEESIAGFVEDEADFVPGFDYCSKFQSQSLDTSARNDSVSWILKVHAFHGFQPLTAYLAVNYLDRFLASHPLPQANGWPLQLLSVACLSLAAKMEEPMVPTLLDLQVEGTKFVFDTRTIQKMELVVLGALDWRLRSITPFTFIEFFAFKLNPSGTFIACLVSRATDIILDIVRDITFINYWPSSVAAAAILCAANEIPSLSSINPHNAALSWCHGLSKGRRILSCYNLMKGVVITTTQRKPPKVLQQLRVTTWASVISTSGESSPSSSCCSSSSSSNKRRKLNNSSSLWVDETFHDKEKSESS